MKELVDERGLFTNLAWNVKGYHVVVHKSSSLAQHYNIVVNTGVIDKSAYIYAKDFDLLGLWC